MIERLRQLEEELAGVRDEGKREALLRELSSLANRVEVATKRVEEDGRSLDEIGRSIERMRAAIGGAPARERKASEEARNDARPGGPAPPVVVLAVVLVLAGIVGAIAMMSGKRRADIDLATPASSIPGFPSAVDPSALVAIARSESRLGNDARLTGIRADYVGANGRVNLRGQGYDGRIAYSFVAPTKEAPAPSSSAPLGAPQPIKPTARTATVTVTSTGISLDPMILVMTDEAVPDPECTVEQVWAAAHAAGAPTEAIAILEYGMKHVFEAGHFVNEPRWQFSIRGTRYKYEIDDPGCHVVDPNAAFRIAPRSSQ